MCARARMYMKERMSTRARASASSSPLTQSMTTCALLIQLAMSTLSLHDLHIVYMLFSVSFVQVCVYADECLVQRVRKSSFSLSLNFYLGPSKNHLFLCC